MGIWGRPGEDKHHPKADRLWPTPGFPATIVAGLLVGPNRTPYPSYRPSSLPPCRSREAREQLTGSGGRSISGNIRLDPFEPAGNATESVWPSGRRLPCEIPDRSTHPSST